MNYRVLGIVVAGILGLTACGPDAPSPYFEKVQFSLDRAPDVMCEFRDYGNGLYSTSVGGHDRYDVSAACVAQFVGQQDASSEISITSGDGGYYAVLVRARQ